MVRGKFDTLNLLPSFIIVVFSISSLLSIYLKLQKTREKCYKDERRVFIFVSVQ